jgi:hypothetical protein
VRIMTALTRMALACGAALVMATAALGALHSDRDPAIPMSPAPEPVRQEVVSDPDLPSGSELDLGSMPGVWATQ